MIAAIAGGITAAAAPLAIWAATVTNRFGENRMTIDVATTIDAAVATSARLYLVASTRMPNGVVAATPRLERWGRHLAAVLPSGARLLTCGNGGSAAEAQHLTGELVGRFEEERMPLSAIALHAETSSATAIANDYGLDEIFARQVRAHARAGDVLLCLSTSGRSPNVLTAAKAAHELGVTT